MDNELKQIREEAYSLSALSKIAMKIKLYTLIQDLPFLVVIINREGIIEYVNTRWHDELGYWPTEMLGKYYTDFMVSDSEQVESSELLRITGLEQGYPPTGEWQFSNTYIHKDGHKVNIKWAGAVRKESGLEYSIGYGNVINRECVKCEKIAKI